MVFVHHFNPVSAARFGNFASAFFNEWYIGVSIFFVLSGFLITIRYYETAALSRTWFMSYFQNRIAKIYPLYFILTTITFLYFKSVDHSWKVYLLHISLMQGFFNDFKFLGINTAWSLTVEESFYVMAPLLFLSIKRYKITFQPLIFLTVGFGLVMLFQRIDFYGFFESYHFMLMYTFFGRCVEFFIGIALAKKYLQRKGEESTEGAWYTSLGVVALLFSVVGLVLLKGNRDFGISSYLGIAFHHTVVPLSTSLLLWGLITENSRIKTLLAYPFTQLLGKSSYAFYLIHLGFFYTLIAIYLSTHIVVIFVVLNGVAICLYQFVEKPLHEAIRAKR
jgi:peptidoglycan/LPS O-acetylase OafA/YrhL